MGQKEESLWADSRAPEKTIEGDETHILGDATSSLDVDSIVNKPNLQSKRMSLIILYYCSTNK